MTPTTSTSAARASRQAAIRPQAVLDFLKRKPSAVPAAPAKTGKAGKVGANCAVGITRSLQRAIGAGGYAPRPGAHASSAHRPPRSPQQPAVRKAATGGSSTKKALGFEPPKINGKEFPFKIGFTKDNELFVGRLAMIGFASSLAGEVSAPGPPADLARQPAASCCPQTPCPLTSPPCRPPHPQILTGKGALGQFGYEIGLDGIEVDGLIAALVVFNLVAAVLPTSQTFVPEEEEAIQDRPKGPLQVRPPLHAGRAERGPANPLLPCLNRPPFCPAGPDHQPARPQALLRSQGLWLHQGQRAVRGPHGAAGLCRRPHRRGEQPAGLRVDSPASGLRGSR